ncbi:hypothetical protein AALO_G00158040 [Alosa alosa]|uniref:Uncharacterized protein n=1 Tax=Alosa alosa TaxID=278164 RepID=A0AAV6GJX2_9TELE|nr:hypothetical protein AALO_G00158040 [Alosa alosa]
MSANQMLHALLGSKHKVTMDLRSNLKQVKKEVKQELVIGARTLRTRLAWVAERRCLRALRRKFKRHLPEEKHCTHGQNGWTGDICSFCLMSFYVPYTLTETNAFHSQNPLNLDRANMSLF